MGVRLRRRGMHKALAALSDAVALIHLRYTYASLHAGWTDASSCHVSNDP